MEKYPFQQYPYLFTNGLFFYNYNSPWIITGYNVKTGNFRVENPTLSNIGPCFFPPKGGKLIARRISSMSSSEWQNIINQYNNIDEIMLARDMLNYWMDNRTSRADDGLWRGMPLLHFKGLLMLGVYPFSQKHFDNNIVINKDDVSI